MRLQRASARNSISLALLLSWSLLSCLNASAAVRSTPGDTRQVALLHGLARTEQSMAVLAERLRSEGFSVCNVSYPSRDYPIVTLARDYVLPALRDCFPDPAKPIHFVTHSLGGIVARQLATIDATINFGRVVMLSPPNKGSEVVDVLGDWWLFGVINGPAGRQLGTSPESVPNSLGPAPFELGVITGSRTINFILSTLIEGRDDGKVSIESAKLAGMSDFMVMPVTHPFIMRDDAVGEQALHFLHHGEFARE